MRQINKIMYSLNIKLLIGLFTYMTDFRYECALVRNWIEGTPVFPIFVADITINEASKAIVFQQLDKISFPDVPHKRNPNAQQILDELGYV